MNTIGKRIHDLRKQNGMTQFELAEKLGVSPSTVGMYEQGRRNPDNSTLIKLGKIFGVTTDSILGVENGKAEGNEASELIRNVTMHLKSDAEITLYGIPMTEEQRERFVLLLEEAIKSADGEKNNKSTSQK